MASYCKLTVVGNVGRDPELKYLSNGTALCSFSVAVTTKRKDEEQTEWFKITAWGKLAETCNQYVKKGMQVLVSGELTIERYKGKNGPQASPAVRADDVLFMNRGNGNEDSGPPAGMPQSDVPF